jgi:hypothetical protein
MSWGLHLPEPAPSTATVNRRHQLPSRRPLGVSESMPLTSGDQTFIRQPRDAPGPSRTHMDEGPVVQKRRPRFGESLLFSRPSWKHSVPVSFAVLVAVGFIVISTLGGLSTANSLLRAAPRAALGLDSLPTQSAPSGTKTLCGPFTSIIPSGVYKGGFGGAYFEDDLTGNLYWCAKGTTHLVADSAFTSQPYEHMAGIVNKTYGLVLVLDLAWTGTPGFWFCYGASSTLCISQSNFISLPTTFCSKMPAGSCLPEGIALDGKLNVYYVDGQNKVVVKCTSVSNYQKCKVIETLSDEPTNLFRDTHGNIWVTDYGCLGDVWENGVLQYSLSDSVGAITISSSNPSKSPHLYLAINAGCGFYSMSFIFDVTDGNIVSAFTSTTHDMLGFSTGLQFTDVYDASVYQAIDKT